MSNLTEIMEKNKKILRAEYQRGFLAGSEKTRKELIEEFLERIDDIIDKVKYLLKYKDSQLPYKLSFLIDDIIILKKEYKENEKEKNSKKDSIH